jgi:NAD(P)-dependent dehydrogenase (short-subunit alcohol dehydrogenase family)
MRCDVLDAAEVNGFAAAVAAWGGGLDLLVNNAGQGRVSTFGDTTDDAWREELELKFFSQILPIRAFRPHRGWGCGGHRHRRARPFPRIRRRPACAVGRDVGSGGRGGQPRPRGSCFSRRAPAPCSAAARAPACRA